jgi:hypothetical protein
MQMTPHRETSDVMKQIDENLRRVYREVDAEEVPDRFKELLDKLRQQDGDDV